MRRFSAILLSAALLLTLLAGCGSKTADGAAPYDDLAMGGGFDMGGFYSVSDAEAPQAYEEAETQSKLAASEEGGLPHDTKMIYRANIELQTLDYVTSETAISELVRSCGGYFESRSVSNASNGYRYGDFIIRVSAEEFEHFCNQIDGMCHVTYLSTSAENITESYYDVDSRLKTAQIKLERLQELLGRADDMADIITVESAISETEREIESLSGTLRHYDALVDYATVYLSLREVYKLSGTESAPVSFAGRIANAFADGLRGAGSFLEELAVRIAEAWVFLTALAVIAVPTVRAARKKKLFRKKEKSLPPEERDRE